MEISRRTFLLGSAALVALGACSDDDGGDEEGSSSPDSVVPEDIVRPEVPADPGLTGPPFTLGVASGDPDDTSAVLWTRLTTAPAGVDVPVLCEVAADEAFEVLVAAEVVTALAADGHSIHWLPDGELGTDAWHWYRFRVGDHVSPVGRTRSASSGLAQLHFAFASCQDWRDGFWPAHAHLAEEELDLVVFLGDYIYEGADGEGQVRQHGAPECETLDDYRARYALYKAHPSLQAAHAARPWLVVWDDHEVDNDFAGGADDIRERQAAAYKAWWEHMPVRMPAPTGPALDINRVVRWGDLASFITLDGRQFRSDQACGGGIGPTCPEVDEPGRTMLGEAQETWVAEAIAASTTAWNVLANQTILAPSEILGFVNFDQWDGYPAARARLYDALRGSDATTVVITGDVHASAVGDLLDDDGSVLGVELVGTSMSSTFPAELVDIFEGAAQAAGAQMADARHRGYVRCTVTADALTAEYRTVESVEVETSPISTASSWIIEVGGGVGPA